MKTAMTAMMMVLAALTGCTFTVDDPNWFVTIDGGLDGLSGDERVADGVYVGEDIGAIDAGGGDNTSPCICDDGDPCTTDSCDPATGCVSTDKDCDDADPYTVDSCDEVMGCTHTPSSCPDDDNKCTIEETDGECLRTNKVCDDSNLCTNDSCEPEKGCVFVQKLVNDENVCTEDECVQETGEVIHSPPQSCDDSNPCTDDTCDPATGCVSTPNTATCDDGDPCTTGDRCLDEACVGNAVPCDCQSDTDCAKLEDGDLCNGTLVCEGTICVVNKATVITCFASENPCTANTCNPNTGKCEVNFISNTCDDADFCTTGDVCDDGVCVGGPAPDCDDNNICTNDSCDPATGCIQGFNTAGCNDDTVCNGNEVCLNGECQTGTPLTCNDSNPCTDDSCDPATGCVHANNVLPCNDNNACTTTDTCGGGSCIGGPAPDCNDQNLCTDDTCDPAIGCVSTNNTVACNDANACTTMDMCNAGACVGGPPPNCNDDNPCTDDSCDPATGCVHANNVLPCNDNNACTTSDVCGDGVCAGVDTSTIDCNDDNLCTDDSCNPAIGCVNADNTAPCNDANACTEYDTCTDGACVGGPPPNCDDGIACNMDWCDKALGCVHPTLDEDCDFVPDGLDNCVGVANTNQTDTDQDNVGDACDPMLNCAVKTGPPNGLPGMFLNTNECVTACKLPNGKVGCIYMYTPPIHDNCGVSNDGDAIPESAGDCNDGNTAQLYQCWPNSLPPPTCEGWAVAYQ